jgi:hypothetical protein
MVDGHPVSHDADDVEHPEAYEPPTVVVLGSLEALTRGNAGVGTDFASELSV